MREQNLALTGVNLPTGGAGRIDTSASPTHGTELFNPKEQYNSLRASDAMNVSGCYELNIVWGQPCLETPVAEAICWSGSLYVNRGAEINAGAIRNKSGRNHLFPHTDLTAGGRTSLPVEQDDGIAVSIVVEGSRLDTDFCVPAAISYENDTVVAIPVDNAYSKRDPVEVVFETGPFSSTFAPTEISALETALCSVDSDMMNDANVQEIGSTDFKSLAP